jgi:hypothetical protein
MIENWKKFRCTNYSVSSLGRARNDLNGHVLKPSIIRGYEYIRIKGVPRSGLHRFIAEAFIPNPENKPEVNHINGIKNDNRISNLEWSTRLENMNHANYELKILDRLKNRFKPHEEQCIIKMHEVYGIGYKCIGEIFRRPWTSIRKVIKRYEKGFIKAELTI